MADINFTRFRPSIIAAAAALTASSKLFPEQVDKFRGIISCWQFVRGIINLNYYKTELPIPSISFLTICGVVDYQILSRKSKIDTCGGLSTINVSS